MKNATVNARDLAPARDGSTPCLSLSTLEACFDRLQSIALERQDAVERLTVAAEEAEASGNIEQAADFDRRADAALDECLRARAERDAVEKDITEWYQIAHSLSLAA